MTDHALSRRQAITAGAVAGLAGIAGSAFAQPAFAQPAAPQAAVTARGTVFQDTDGSFLRGPASHGVPGVMVSNGHDVVLTDTEGRWSLPVADGELPVRHQADRLGAAGRPLHAIAALCPGVCPQRHAGHRLGCASPASPRPVRCPRASTSRCAGRTSRTVSRRCCSPIRSPRAWPKSAISATTVVAQAVGTHGGLRHHPRRRDVRRSVLL